MPKSGTSPILQQQTPAVHKSGIAAPNVNVPHANNYAPPLNSFAFPPRQPNQKTNDYSPQLQSSPAPPPPPTSLQPFPLIGQSQSAPVHHNRQPSNSINTNVNKVPSINSPYVPNAGPYAPLTHQRSHSRASSLVGGKGKEVNPYALHWRQWQVAILIRSNNSSSSSNNIFHQQLRFSHQPELVDFPTQKQHL